MSAFWRLTSQFPGRLRDGVQSRATTIDGRDVVYHVAGRGEPLILVHGLAGSGRWWWRNLRELAEHYETFIVDLPGFGSMRSDEIGFDINQASEYLGEWMSQIGIQRASVVAHSLGGLVAIHLGRSYPDCVDKLILVAPAGVNSERGLLDYSWPLVRAARQLRPSFALVLARDFLTAGPRTILRAARDLLDEDILPMVREIDIPVLLIWGVEDPMVPVSVGEILHREFPDARLLAFDGVGHVPMIDHSEEFNAAVLAFLQGKPVGE